eukprot:scaffold112094_cov84-Phaeocystis_antarctica.AAC.1
MAACLNVCGLKVKVNVGAWAVCSAVTCGAWRTLVRWEPRLGDVAGEGTLELWSLCGWAQIRVEVALRFLWELRSADWCSGCTLRACGRFRACACVRGPISVGPASRRRSSTFLQQIQFKKSVCLRVSSDYLTPYSAFRYYLFKASRNLLVQVVSASVTVARI